MIARRDRIPFIRFNGFSFTGSLPDHSSIICRFRNSFLVFGIYEDLFEEIAPLRNSLVAT
jgi:hypothetical protein